MAPCPALERVGVSPAPASEDDLWAALRALSPGQHGDYSACETHVVAGDKVQVKWEYPGAGASVVVQHDGPVNRVFVRVSYAGKARTGTPNVPFAVLAQLVHDPRWQQ